MTDFLLYVEDPGAANYSAQIPDALRDAGYSCHTIADGYAKGYFTGRDISFNISAWRGNAAALINDVMPRAVIVGTSENPDSFSFELIEVAKQRGIPSVGFIDMAGNAAYRFRGKSDNSLYYAPDWLLVPDEYCAETFSACGYDRDRLIICGHPQYDMVRAVRTELEHEGRDTVRARSFSVAEDRKIIMFAAEINSGLEVGGYRKNSEYTLIGLGGELRTEVVLEEFLHAVESMDRDRLYLVLRLHPKNRPEEFSKYVNHFDAISRGGEVLPLVYASDLLAGMTTNLLLEGALLDVPTLSIVPREAESRSLATVRCGITKAVWRRKALRESLFRLMSSNDAGGPIRRLCDEFFPAGAVGRNVAGLSRIVETRNAA